MEQRNHDAVLVTLADRNFIDQAKQLFSSVYWNAGWKGDYMLLSHEIPEKDLKWFRDKGILVKKCKPLTGGALQERPPCVYDKFYLFTPEFKKWKNIVYLDSDIIVRASLDRLAKVKGFWAVRDLGESKLRNQVSKKGIKKISQNNYYINAPAFNSGVMAFSTEIIRDDAFQDLTQILDRYIKISLYSDQLILNLYFYKKWEKLPTGYNVLNHILRHYHSNKKKIDAISLHFVTQEYSYHRPWDKKNYFYKEWKNNLAKAESIDLSKIPLGKKWSSFKIFRNSVKIQSKCILSSYEKKVSVAKNLLKYFLKAKVYNLVRKILVFKIIKSKIIITEEKISLFVKDFFDYLKRFFKIIMWKTKEIWHHIRHFPPRILGIIGQTIKKISPKLYRLLKGIIK